MAISRVARACTCLGRAIGGIRGPVSVPVRSAVEHLRQLRAEDKGDEYLRGARALAAAHPTDAHAQCEAAYACYRYGTEEEAVQYYDAAARLGVPAEERRPFAVG
jgi:hypothetical protein